jgi:hypothetical protein
MLLAAYEKAKNEHENEQQHNSWTTHANDNAFDARVLEIFSVDNPTLVNDAHDLYDAHSAKETA